MFRTEMWKFQATFDMHIDDHLEALNEHTREAALRIFGSHKDTPRKPWISSVTWQIVKGITPMRRTVHFIRKRYYWWRASMCFRAWMFTRCDGSLVRWTEYGSALDAANQSAWCAKHEAAAYASIFRLQKEAQPSLEADRRAYLDSLAMRAERAAELNNTRVAYAVVKSLSAASIQYNPMIKKLDGTLTECPDEADERWQEHYAKVFGGEVVTAPSLRQVMAVDAHRPNLLDGGPAATEASYAKLANNKGLGPDQIPAELLKAGGSALACKYSEINTRVAADHAWPSQWRGGRVKSFI